MNVPHSMLKINEINQPEEATHTVIPSIIPYDIPEKNETTVTVKIQ